MGWVRALRAPGSSKLHHVPTLEADISSEESLFKYTFIATWQAPIHRSSPPAPEVASFGKPS